MELVQGISGYKIYQLESGTFKDITPSGLGLLTKTTITASLTVPNTVSTQVHQL